MIRALAFASVLAGCVAQPAPPAQRQMPRNFAQETPLYCAAFYGAEADTARGRSARIAAERAAAFWTVSIAIFGDRPEVDGLIFDFQADLAETLAQPDHDVNGDTSMMRRDCASFGRTQPETKPLFGN